MTLVLYRVALLTSLIEISPNSLKCWQCSSVDTALQGWPGTKMWCEKDKKTKAKKKKRRHQERDLKALNRGATDLGAVTAPEVRAYRSVYDARMKAVEDESLRRAPLVFPPDMVFGHPPRYVQPGVHVSKQVSK